MRKDYKCYFQYSNFMQIIHTQEIPKESANSPLFAGGEVTRQFLLSDQMSRDFNMTLVNFSKGAKNKFHFHDKDQALVVTAGKGIVATKEKEWIVIQGDVILIPAREIHWHGATPDSEFSHIALTPADTQLTQVEE